MGSELWSQVWKPAYQCDDFSRPVSNLSKKHLERRDQSLFGEHLEQMQSREEEELRIGLVSPPCTFQCGKCPSVTDREWRAACRGCGKTAHLGFEDMNSNSDPN